MTETVDDVVQPTAEDMAAAQGHVNLDQWKEQGKDPADWKDARTYLREGEMISSIKKQGDAIDRYKAEIGEVKTALKDLTEHHKKIAQLERDKAIKELKARKVSALREDDHESVVEIDEQIEELKEEKLEAQQAPSAPPIPVEVTQWLQDPKNVWYHDDPDLNFDADKLFNFKLKKGRTDFSVMLKELEDEIRVRHPKKFVRQGTQRTAIVDKEIEGRPGTGKKHSYRDLDENQLSVAKRFVKMGTYKNIQEYVDELEKLGELSSKR
jgi:hypothetical protein